MGWKGLPMCRHFFFLALILNWWSNGSFLVLSLSIEGIYLLWKVIHAFCSHNFFTFFVWTRNTKTIKSNELGAYKSCANICHIYIKDSLNLKHWISFIVWINIYFFLRSTWLGLMHVINLKVYDYLIKKKYILIWTMKLN